MKAVLHYLYFPTQASAERVAADLRTRGMEVEERPSADGVNWLVLVRHGALTDREFAATRVAIERIVQANHGEYDGWEAEV